MRSDPMRRAVIKFFDQNENWLAAVIEQGQIQGSIPVDGSSQELAQMIIGAIEGARLVARTYQDPSVTPAQQGDTSP